jgi:type IV pilus assembly protein PilB
VKLSRYERKLISEGLVDEGKLASARARQAGAKRPLIEVLVEQNAAPESELLAVLSKVSGIAIYTPLLSPTAAVQDFVPAEVAQRHGVLPLHISDANELIVATTDPFQLPVFDDIRARAELRVKRVLVGPTKLRAAMSTTRQGEEALDNLLKHATPLTSRLKVFNTEGQALPDYDEFDDKAPAVQLIDHMFSDAIRKGASDIHVEAEKSALRIRYRIDGRLRDVLELPASLHSSVIKRLKIITDLNTIESRRPQDGRAKICHGEKSIDIRISTIPSYFGEKAVIRLLDSGAECFDLNRTGFDAHVLERWRSLLARPYGLLLVTGPTGSGKTSTLYASILEKRSPSLNIVTVEDPVEYQFPGIVHVPVRSDIGMTFAAGLRSILRQDPDVVLLGEIRDSETAEVALRAAVTGHLVLSTLHTNDSIGAITRLIDLGAAPSLIASALLGVMSQRLVRTTCTECAEPCVHPPGAMAALDPSPIDWAQHSARFARGCPQCFGTGYRGRSAVAELVVATRPLKDLLNSKAPESDLRKQARLDGSKSLAACGLAKILNGQCTPDEVLKVVVAEGSLKLQTPDTACGGCGGSLEEGWRLCPACGHEIAPKAEPKPTEWPCASCSETIKASWKVCPFCGSEASPPAAEPAQAPTVVVCDDNKVVRCRIRAILGDAYGEVIETADGDEALDAIAKRRPDLLIVDQQMPRVTGLQVIRSLRSNLETAQMPIIMLTGLEGDEMESAALDAGADDYLTKPVRPARLRSRIRALLAARARAGKAQAA